LKVKKMTFEIKNNKFLKKAILREGFSIYDQNGNVARTWYRINSPKKSRKESHTAHEYDTLNRPTLSVFYEGDLNSTDTIRYVLQSYTDSIDEICEITSENAEMKCKRIEEERITYAAYVENYGINGFIQPHEYVDSAVIKKEYKNEQYIGRELYFYKYDSLDRISYEFQSPAEGATGSIHINYTYEENKITKAYLIESNLQWMNQEKDYSLTYVISTLNSDGLVIREERYTYSETRECYYDIWYIRNFDDDGNIIQHEYGGSLYPDRKEKYLDRIVLYTYQYKHDSNGRLIEKRETNKIKGSKNTDETSFLTYEFW
jgi:hypothetical protein